MYELIDNSFMHVTGREGLTLQISREYQPGKEAPLRFGTLIRKNAVEATVECDGILHKVPLQFVEGIIANSNACEAMRTFFESRLDTAIGILPYMNLAKIWQAYQENRFHTGIVIRYSDNSRMCVCATVIAQDKVTLYSNGYTTDPAHASYLVI